MSVRKESAMKVDRDLNRMIRAGAYIHKNALQRDAHKWVYIITIIVCLVAICFFAGCAGAEEITDAKAIHCILGEARSDGYAAMLGHAEAIRNRGTLKGVYGCRVDLSHEMSYLKVKRIDVAAKQAWESSRYTHTVAGAQFWGSMRVDKKWIAQMRKHRYTQTAQINGTAFFKRRIN